MSYALSQLAHSKLLPQAVSTAILAGDTPPFSTLIDHLMTATMDAHFMTTGDKNSSWTERRVSHQNLVTAYMVALLWEQTFGAEKRGAGATTNPEKSL